MRAVPQGSGAAKKLSGTWSRGTGFPAICVGDPARTEMQLKRSGTNVAKWGFHVLSHQRFQRLKQGSGGTLTTSTR